MRIVVLGAGMVGGAIARDLAREPGFRVKVADRDQRALEALKALAAIDVDAVDLHRPDQLRAAIKDADLVVGALPGHLGFETLRQVIEAGKNVVDISFFPEDPFPLDALARQRQVTAVVDCGVAPGLSNIVAGYVRNELDTVESYCCYVGGLPRVRRWPYEYKAVFSPLDVLEEFTRPARFVEHGEEVVRPALSDVELIDFRGVGTLEAFNTDGLRTLVRTLDAPYVREKTLRYPGHANLVRIFRESGFFGTEPVEVDGQRVRPIALTARLLSDQWRMDQDEEDVTVMLVIMDGTKNGGRQRHEYYLLDHYDPVTHTTSMARTTGYTCAIVTRQVANEMFSRQGICPPEYIGATEGCFDDLLAGYEQRHIHVDRDLIEQTSSLIPPTSAFQQQIA